MQGLPTADNELLDQYLKQEGIPKVKPSWQVFVVGLITNLAIVTVLILSTQFQWVHNLALFLVWLSILFLCPLSVGLLGWSSWDSLKRMDRLTDDEIRQKCGLMEQSLATIPVSGFLFDAMSYLTMAIIGWTVTALTFFFASLFLLLPRGAMLMVFMGLVEQIRVRGLVKSADGMTESDESEDDSDEDGQDLTEPESAL